MIKLVVGPDDTRIYQDGVLKIKYTPDKIVVEIENSDGKMSEVDIIELVDLYNGK